MPTAHLHFDIQFNARVEDVWKVLWGDQSWPRTFTDLVQVETTPKGPAVVGQSFHYVRKIEGKSVHFLSKLIEVQPLKSWRGIETSKGLFERLEDSGALIASAEGAKIVVDYYLETGPGTVLRPKELREGLDTFWRNAKKLIESA